MSENPNPGEDKLKHFLRSLLRVSKAEIDQMELERRKRKKTKKTA